MNSWPISDDRLRAMYQGGHAGTTARRFARVWAAAFGLGLLPKRWVTLEVAGRRSGRITRFPLGMADWNGHWYLVPMLGEHCNWVQNVRAADGRATLRHRRAVPCRLVEIPLSERAAIIRRYLEKVPGARPHLPVGRHAALADFEAIAPRYPVFQVVPADPPHGAASTGRPLSGVHYRQRAITQQDRSETPGPRVARGSSRRRHWWRWLLAAAGLLAAMAIAAVALFIELQPSPSALALPTARASAPAGPLGGMWAVAAGSVAGFRVGETALGFSNDVVGRTSAVTGTLTISSGQVIRAALHVDLTSIKVNGKIAPQFTSSLGTRAHPAALFTLTQPVTLGSAFTSGATITRTAPGRLTMHGLTHPVTVTITGRRDGPQLQAAGSIPVAFSRWGIKTPGGFGFLGSLANHGLAEFRLILHRGDGARTGK
jgi:polyisoprenoid-binding protein YceI